MSTDMHWKSEAAFVADLNSATESRLRDMHRWFSAGEARASGTGRHSSPSTRRQWKVRREAVERVLENRRLDW